MSSFRLVTEHPDKFRIRWDEQRGSIRFELIGFLSPEEAKICYSILNRLWALAQQSHGRLLFLVDASQAQVQVPEMLKDLRSSNPQQVSARDRIAIIVSSSLVKMQFRRNVRDSEASVAFFTSPDEAETWIVDEASPSPNP
jgi:hypothetical protein